MADAGSAEQMSARAVPLTARAAGLVACRVCGRVHAGGTDQCVRCGARLVSRDMQSLQRVWAWMAAGVLAYIPANIYPMLLTTTLGRTTENTLAGGIIELAGRGSWGVAAIVFVASVLIPVGTFLAIAHLALGLRRGSRVAVHTRHRLHEVVDFVGRWSMIDVFVVAILSSLVHLGAAVSIKPGVAAFSFALSAGFTMLSATSFDPRLILGPGGKDRVVAPDDLPEPATDRPRSPWRNLSPVWLVPVAAVVISLAIAWTSFANRGTVINIRFQTAADVVPGETAVKFRDVVIGTVERVHFTPDLGNVVVVARIEKDVAATIPPDALFWVVTPVVSTRGISGRSTVLSGAYVEGAWTPAAGARGRGAGGRRHRTARGHAARLCGRDRYPRPIARRRAEAAARRNLGRRAGPGRHGGAGRKARPEDHGTGGGRALAAFGRTGAWRSASSGLSPEAAGGWLRQGRSPCPRPSERRASGWNGSPCRFPWRGRRRPRSAPHWARCSTPWPAGSLPGSDTGGAAERDAR